MKADLSPEKVLGRLESGRTAPVYLFYGPDEFRLERLLDRMKRELVPEGVRDFNLEIFYGGDTAPGAVMDAARSLPFMAERRLVIVRRTDAYTSSELERFLPYLDDPPATTCLVFLAAKTDFRHRFYKRIRQAGGAVFFQRLGDSQVIPWIKRTAKELGLRIEGQAAAYLYRIAGNRTRDLYGELEKLQLRHGERTVGVEEVKELASTSRIYTIFELMDLVSLRKGGEALAVLNRYLEEEREGALRIIGMLGRQIRILVLFKASMAEGKRPTEALKKLGLPGFMVRTLSSQVKVWEYRDLEDALEKLRRADDLVKSGADERLILENLVAEICF